MMGHMWGNYGNWDQAPDYMKQMMQKYYGGTAPFLGFAGVMEFITWILLVILLIAAIRYLWNKGGGK
mgnify:CR=1 FL=1